VNTSLFGIISEDIRFKEGLSACMNCGVCTAICPAAEFYDYDPRHICNVLLSRNDSSIEKLLEEETIWNCGQCLSCKTRCPRGNVPGLLIAVLRELAVRTGKFTSTTQGCQQYAVKKTVGDNIINTGYCVHLMHVKPHLHPEQGPVWEWYYHNAESVSERLGANYNKDGAGALRKIPDEDLDEIRRIFEVTGGKSFFETIEKFARDKAEKLNKNMSDTLEYDEFFYHVFVGANQK